MTEYEKIYKQAIKNGCSERLADMLASRKAPDSVTEAEFFKGRHTLAQQFKGNESQLNYITKEAKKRGFTPTPNMVYEAGLAKFVGDPAAFIPASGGKDHVKAVCKKRNWRCEGAVNVSNNPGHVDLSEPTMNPKLVEQYARQMATDKPELRRKTKAEVRQMAKQKHTYK